jgi:adenine deaminase
LVSDDRYPTDLVSEGHVNFLLRRAVSLGLPPVTAIQLVTINPAKYFFTVDLGAVAPGYRADIVLLEDLVDFHPRAVLKDGVEVARDGELTVELPPPVPPPRGAVNIGWSRMSGFGIPAEAGVAKVIELIPDQLTTAKVLLPVAALDGAAVADPARDIAKLAVVERHRGSGNCGLGFVRGFGFQAGAIASSVAHDSHNIVAVGVDDADMLAAVREVERMQGGLAVVKGGEVLAALALPIAGLMSDRAMEEVVTAMRGLIQAAHDLGSTLSNPFMSLSFLALPVIPALRLTDRGLVDVDEFRIVPLFGEG